MSRNPHDFYPTPASCVDAFLGQLTWPSDNFSFHEPCLGSGNVYNKIPTSNKTFCEIQQGIDYLNTGIDTCDLIITNPPFSLAKEFLTKSLDESRAVCYLMRLGMLSSQGRYEFWTTILPPTHLFICSTRPSFTGSGTDRYDYAWYCWDEDNLFIKNKPTLNWLLWR